MDPNGPHRSAQTALAQEMFVLQWGRMSSSWGINRTMAQIHAYLLSSGRPTTVETLIESLHISRGNASMNLRDLMDWGIVRRSRMPGDRKDVYQCEGDVLHMFARVVRERKRRELDPTVAAIRECLSMVPADDDSEDAGVLRDRLSALVELFGVIDQVYEQVFESEESLEATLQFFREAGRRATFPTDG